MCTENSILEFNTNETIIKSTKNRIIRLYLLAVLFPVIFMSYFFSLINEYQQTFILTFVLSILLISLVIIFSSKNTFKNLKNVKAVLSNDKIIYLASHKNYSFEIEIKDIVLVKPKYKKQLINALLIKTPYLTAQIHSVENIDFLYQKMEELVNNFDKNYLEPKDNTSNSKRIIKTKKIINILFILIILVFGFRLYQLKEELNFDLYIELIRVISFFFMFLYFGLTSLIKIMILKEHKKLNKMMIIQVVMYFSLSIYLAIKVGPKVLNIIF